MKLQTIKQIKNLKNKRVILRTDFNVPMNEEKIIDDYRIKMSLPTIEYLLKKKARIVVVSHLGRPGGKPSKKLSLLPVVQRLEKILKQKIAFVSHSFGDEAKEAVETLEAGEILVLENIRFYPQEKENSAQFAKKIASLADVYINDAFAVSHRKQASVVAITKYLPSYTGLLLEEEIKKLSQTLSPTSPSVAIVGGAKISSKIKLINKLNKKFDHILLGSAISTKFIKEAGYEVGKSYVEKDFELNLKKYNFEKIILPVDVVVGDRGAKNKDVDLISKSEIIRDIGPETFKMFKIYLANAKTIVWNGPLGLIEDSRFIKHSRKLVAEIVKNKKAKIFIGGGETASLFKNKKPNSNIFISTGGGAMLEFLEGKVLPGIKVLYK